MLTKVYQHDKNGYYLGEEIAYNDDLPNNCTKVKPTLKDGYIPQWSGKKWVQVENNIGIKGYLDNVPFEMKEYGPLPKGFTDKMIESLDQAKNRARQLLRTKRKAVEYGGFEFNNMKWDSEEKDELRLNSIMKMFEITGNKELLGWKMSEGNYITLTPDLAVNAATNLMVHYAKAFAIEATKFEEINNLSTVAKVNYWIEHQLNMDW